MSLSTQPQDSEIMIARSATRRGRTKDGDRRGPASTASFGMLRRLLLVLVAMVLRTESATAQCLNWSNAFHADHFLGGNVGALATFDDGTGPALYAGWDLGVSRWDGTNWTYMGPTDSFVLALRVWDDGTGPALYAGGDFTQIGGVSAAGLAKWDGYAWSQVTSGMGCNGCCCGVFSLFVHDDGSGPALFMGGSFIQGIAKWDGTTLSGVGGGVANATYGGSVLAMAVYDDGSGPALYAGGDFSIAGGVPVNGVAKWDGSTWTAVGSFLYPTLVEALESFDDGTGSSLYAGGGFYISGYPWTGLARWNGSSWSPVGGGTSGPIYAFAQFDDGNGTALYAGGQVSHAGSVLVNGIARWDGSTWSPLGSGLTGRPYALAVHDDGTGGGSNLYLGGHFYEAGGLRSRNVAEWHRCSDNVESFCFGDGSVATCPCGNFGRFGHGCRNSAGTGGGVLRANGTTQPDALVLSGSAVLPTSLSVFLQGDALIYGSVVFGDGLRCTGGNLKRLFIRNASQGAVSVPQAGDPSITARSAQLGDPIAPGTTRYYQVYYRDPDPNFCPAPTGGLFNVTNGIRVVW